MGNYLYDIFMYAVLSAFAIGLTHVFDVKRLLADDAYLAVIVLFTFYGLANVPLTFLISYLFQ